MQILLCDSKNYSYISIRFILFLKTKKGLSPYTFGDRRINEAMLQHGLILSERLLHFFVYIHRHSHFKC